MTTQQILQGVHDWTNGKIVYDISVAHPDGQGNPTKYADLTAALGTGGANIPEALRKGGMSVKFVSSSDNKYVQFRYMGTAVTGNPNPFLDTANWQGVDSVPTDGSKNIVESGGIYTWVMGLIATIKTWAMGLFAKTDGYYESMTVGRADNLTGEPIPVTTGYTLKPTGYDPTQPELEFADGIVNMTEIRGRACAWNQLVQNGDFADGSNWIFSSTITTTYLTGGGVKCTINFKGEYNQITQTLNATIPTGHKIFIRLLHKTPVNVLFLIIGNPYYAYYKDVTGTGNAEYAEAAFIGALNKDFSSLQIRIITTNVEETPVDVYLKGIEILDLTLLNPTLAAKQNLTVAEVEAYLASIRTPKPYYAQNAGALLGAKMLGWQLTKAANLLNPTTKQAKLFSYTYTGHDNEYTVNGWDELTGAALQFTPCATGVAEAVTLDGNNHFVIPSAGVLEVVEAKAGTAITGDVSRVCIVATWDGSMNDVYSAYEEDNIEIDSANIYYDNNGVKTQVFEDGILRSTGDGAGDVRDRVYFDEIAKEWKAEVKVVDIDMGNKALSYNPVGTYLPYGEFYFSDSAIRPAVDNEVGKKFRAICSKYKVNNSISSFPGLVAVDKTCFQANNGGHPGKRINFTDSTYTNADLVDGKAPWLAGQHIYVQRETPIIHNTLYYKVGNEYLPMEEVFPDGIQGRGCNWVSESLVEQGDDANGQPQSITPMTTEVFESDLKELLKTIGDTYVSKEQAKDSFDNLLSALNSNSGTALGGSYETDGFNSDGTVKFKFTANE